MFVVAKIKGMHKLILFAVLIIVLEVVPASACTCAAVSVQDARDAAELVFLGTAEKIEYRKDAIYPSGENAGDEMGMRFKVKRWWKGKNVDEVVIFTESYLAPDRQSISRSTCRPEIFDFIIGKEYVVYARTDSYDGILRVTICSRTTIIEKAKEDLKKLGKGKKPKPTK